MQKPDWNPALYDRFADERERPSRDLLARVPLAHPHIIVDLGCGSGLSTRPLVERFPDARVIGIDTSPAMLEKARKVVPEASFELGDAATWVPETPVDLIFANAVLQWLPDHRRLLPHLIAQLAPGGVIAIQMPDNLDEPSHRGMRGAAAAGAWKEKLAQSAGTRTELLSLGETYDLLQPLCRHIDLWTTTYLHMLDSHTAIIDWFSSTGLKPYLDPLDADERAGFIELYMQHLQRGYEARIDGKVMLAFPRRFLVAVK